MHLVRLPFIFPKKCHNPEWLPFARVIQSFLSCSALAVGVYLQLWGRLELKTILIAFASRLRLCFVKQSTETAV